MEFKTTFTATKSRTFAVPFVGMPTVRALLRSVSSIHKENVLSKSFCFVTDKLLKLVERPVIELAVKLFASSLLNSDLAQIFKSKYSVFRVHNLLGYAVIGISHKPSFLTGHSLKLAFGRTGAFGLESPFCRDRERFGVSPHRIEENPTILVSQPKLKCNRPKHVIYVGG